MAENENENSDTELDPEELNEPEEEELDDTQDDINIIQDEEEEEEEEEEGEEGEEGEQEGENRNNDLEEEIDIPDYEDDEAINEIIQKEDDDSSDTESDDYNFEKIDEEYKINYIKKIHPEVINDNYDVINNLTKITRDQNNIIIDDMHKTLPILTKYEKTKILGLRISQLNKGAEPFVELNKQYLDTYFIAEKELNYKVLPYIIMRPLPNGKKEYWKLEDLEIIEY